MLQTACAIPSAPRVDGAPNTLEARDLRLALRGTMGGWRTILDILSFRVDAGGIVAVTGPSGSGKTSLLHVLSGIEKPSWGAVRWGEFELSTAREVERDRWRRRNVGFVFQDFHLLAGMSALDNVLVAATFESFGASAPTRARAVRLLDRVGLCRYHERVETLSRGEMQRVAVARALLHEPPVIFADEPTASLDAASGAAVSDLLLDLSREAGSTLIVVTHDQALLARIGDVRRLVDGGFS